MDATLVKTRMADDSIQKPDSKRSIVVVKGSDEWAKWYRRLVKHSRMKGPVLIDVALKEWAERNSFNESPPER